MYKIAYKNNQTTSKKWVYKEEKDKRIWWRLEKWWNLKRVKNKKRVPIRSRIRKKNYQR
jgi:hypothetical protein